MLLSLGASIGPYQVTALIGKGGMGEVYQATDNNLARQVALKVLPEAFASDPERLARFEREAKTLAQLNHPNIAQIYGLEKSGATTALVMELVEGPTLAERLASAQGSGIRDQGSGLPMEEALAIAKQIAEALEAAHEQGIVHRDLKPANIKLRPDGTVKVLDFGLAKAIDAGSGTRDPGLVDFTQSPTITTPAMTHAGMILGTASYMSPEQARGARVDQRADIWAFGVVVWEMLTGKRLFNGATVSDTVAEMLKSDPDFSMLPAETPARVRQALRVCLRKDVRERIGHVRDLQLVLDGAFEGPTGTIDAAPSGSRVSSRHLVAALVVFALGVSVGVFTWSLRRPGESAPVSRLAISLSGQRLAYTGRRAVAVSPDGTHVAYTSAAGLVVRPLSDLRATPLPGTSTDARNPFFSPDGQSVGYYGGGQLWRVSIGGGAPVPLATVVNPWGAHWGDDDTIVYGQGADGIWRVPATGGDAAQIVTLESGEIAYGPQMLPGQDWILFTLLDRDVGSWNQASIVMQSLETGERSTIVEGGRDARYVAATGHLLYALNETLLAAPFEVEAPQAVRTAVTLLEGVLDSDNITGASQFDVAAAGTLVYIPTSTSQDNLQLTWVDRNGREEPIPGGPRAFRRPRVSPDGARVAVEIEESTNADVWTGDSVRGAFSRLTLSPAIDTDPLWTPDGQRVVFYSARDGGGLFSRAANGAGSAERLLAARDPRPLGWTADGRLLFEELIGSDVQVLNVGAEAKPERFTLIDDPAYFNQVQASLSPDGRWLAYISSEAGEGRLVDVYVRPFPNIESGRWRISSSGGISPVWSPAGDELYFDSAGTVSYRSTGSLMAARIQIDAGFSAAPPVPLFSLEDYVFPGRLGRKFDIGPDGRFLMLKETTPSGVADAGDQIIVVQNFFTELARLAR